MKLKRSTSKRVPLGRKYKIQKKVAQHRRKVKKIVSKSVILKNRKPKILKIPNSWPFKEQMLNEIIKKQDNIKLEKEQRRKNMKEEVKMEEQDTELSEVMEIDEVKKSKLTNLDDLYEDAIIRQGKFEESSTIEDINYNEVADSSRRVFLRDLRKLIEVSDIILEILDARDPLGYRCHDLERSIVGQGKKLILIINKVDLVPSEVAMRWLTYLRREFPTLAFKSAINSSSDHGVNQVKGNGLGVSEEFLKTSSAAFGTSALMSLIKNYARCGDKSRSVTVGIIGYPNVGKSSLVNSLKRSCSVKVGAIAGITRQLQYIDLDSTTQLVDSPGVVFTGNSTDPINILRNTVQLTNVKDYFDPINILLEKTSKEILLKLYRLPDFNDTHDFLTSVARSRGKINKGGIPDTNTAAIIVLSDWFTGKIPFYTLPPDLDQQEKSSISVVSNWSEEFKLDDLFTDNNLNIL
ncbi:hypothetical protein cand_001810 [Cryptosporidium andersoni]|uniref:CP-type G domain-containing protein n=1 Tax=Cryptosporidium andersoni TaxID=117008 RepID=A0A1J4MTW6_9CRYT|nr:hypothetical protein cand_001810 [Cryptosporidium andersoni]